MPNQHLGVFIADASGHGSAAALLVSIVKALMTTVGRDIASPSYVIQLINKTLADLTPDDAFVTLFYGVINTDTGRMLYSLAGHPPPIICNRHSGDLTLLETNGSLVGVFDFDKFTDSEYYFKAGDRLVAYTDGIIEATDDKKNYFGQNKLVSIVQNNPQLQTESVISTLLQELNEFTRGASLADDVTILVVDYDKENENNTGSTRF
jgi:sigma-B regulation protein RsbU (phosphoserine phosphatase)